MFSEESLLPISALQHLLFCERQCALIHLEGQWAENRLTAEGHVLHWRAHDGPPTQHGGLRVERGIALRSMRLGLVGNADVVEFRPAEQPGRSPTPFPIEYKRGKSKTHDADRVQLCAQALCLEEMLSVSVPSGALFNGQTRRREDVVFGRELRETTESAATRLHALVLEGITPLARRERKCDACSLIDICMPDAMSGRHSASQYFVRALDDRISSDVPEVDR